jgi:hypothetical protein
MRYYGREGLAKILRGHLRMAQEHRGENSCERRFRARRAGAFLARLLPLSGIGRREIVL